MNIFNPSLPSPVTTSTAGKSLEPLLLMAGGAAIAYAGICFALYNVQRKLIFRPRPEILRTPADGGLPYEDVWISITDQLAQSENRPEQGLKQDVDQTKQSVDTLHGWWIPNPGSQRVLLFCHGNYGNISYNLERLQFHHSLGFSIFAFDYRGYGQSTASAQYPTENSTYADVDAAWHYLTHERQIAPERITVCGHSMGGAIAINLAVQHPEIARLIIKSSFTTMKAAIDAKKTYRFFPVEQLLQHPFDSLSKVKDLKIPVLYVHGDQDFDVPADMSKTLHAATPGPKTLWIAPGADHNNISAVQHDAYAAVITAFCADSYADKQLQSA
ncbi:MAG: alpha/beta hydrolase [Phormidesmis sp.]